MLKRYDEAQLAASLETDRQGERFRVLEGRAAAGGADRTEPHAPDS
jgi:hypothetical protein